MEKKGHLRVLSSFIEVSLQWRCLLPAPYDGKQLTHFKCLWWPLNQEAWKGQQWEQNWDYFIFLHQLILNYFVVPNWICKLFQIICLVIGVEILLWNLGGKKPSSCSKYILKVKYLIKSVSIILRHPWEQRDEGHE